MTAKMKPDTHVMLMARQKTAIVMLAPVTQPLRMAFTMIPAQTSPRGIMPMARASRVRRLASSR